MPVAVDQETVASGFEIMARRLNEWRLNAGPHDGAPTANLGQEGDAGDLEGVIGPLVTKLLQKRGIAAVDGPSRYLLLEAFALALSDAFENRARNARGDYSPDPKSERFPEWQAPAKPTAAGASLTGLVEDWWREAAAAGRKASTYESYRNTMRRFTVHLGHDDVSRVTKADVLAFKDARLKEVIKPGRTVSAQTVNGSDLAGLKTVFAWAVSNERIPENYAAGVTIKVGKKRRLRSKGFNDEEARAILRAASATVVPPWRKAAKHQTSGIYQARAQRWIPWLCCYTGARVGEMAQLRKQDLRQVGESWVLNITPEAGTVKTDEARDVVLHAHLIEMGFATFVADCEEGYLFLSPTEKGNVRGRWRGLKNRLAAFARQIVPDPEVAPNHGWRHRFKTTAREVGLESRVVDAIQGHAPKDVSDSYGDVSVKAIAAAIARFPRIETEQAAAGAVS